MLNKPYVEQAYSTAVDYQYFEHNKNVKCLEHNHDGQQLLTGMTIW